MEKDLRKERKMGGTVTIDDVRSVLSLKRERDFVIAVEIVVGKGQIIEESA